METVEIYTTPICGFCARAKSLLSKKGVSFSETNVMINSSKKAEMIQRANGHRTVPQIFIDDKHISGCDDLFALEYNGKLDPMLAA